mmetsp:Transcript_4139/g.5324  ORF Transcript_4139/g.5324 Transcript_4139/m.5324 type:complete len:105 (-) Transcript_4139:1857-2171(-)
MALSRASSETPSFAKADTLKVCLKMITAKVLGGGRTDKEKKYYRICIVKDLLIASITTIRQHIYFTSLPQLRMVQGIDSHRILEHLLLQYTFSLVSYQPQMLLQ